MADRVFYAVIDETPVALVLAQDGTARIHGGNKPLRRRPIRAGRWQGHPLGFIRFTDTKGRAPFEADGLQYWIDGHELRTIGGLSSLAGPLMSWGPDGPPAEPDGLRPFVGAWGIGAASSTMVMDTTEGDQMTARMDHHYESFVIWPDGGALKLSQHADKDGVSDYVEGGSVELVGTHPCVYWTDDLTRGELGGAWTAEPVSGGAGMLIQAPEGEVVREGDHLELGGIGWLNLGASRPEELSLPMGCAGGLLLVLGLPLVW